MFKSLMRAITVPHDSQVWGSITAPHDSEQMTVQKEADNAHFKMYHRVTCSLSMHVDACMDGHTKTHTCCKLLMRIHNHLHVRMCLMFADVHWIEYVNSVTTRDLLST